MIGNVIVRVILTGLLIGWAVFPYLQGSQNENALGEILAIGIWPSMLLIAGFFLMVAFYCRSIQKCLDKIHPENRKMNPTAVWYMFLIPFNFVEDFFIVIHLSHAIEEEKKSNSKLDHVKDTGLVTGMGWCIAQILSFIPNIVGQIAGVVGMILVIIHWIQVVKITKSLQNV